MSYTYATFVTALSTEINIVATNTAFITILPTVIDDSESRIYRDLDLLSSVVTDTSASFTSGSRNFILPTSLGRIVEVKRLNFFTSYPTGRHQLFPLPLSIINALFPNEEPSPGELPLYYSPVTDQQFIVGPSPESAYRVEVMGTIRPVALSATNVSTFLSNYLSDLFFSAAMVSISGYMRNFGAQSDDPKMAVSWEGMYQERLKSANAEEARRKFSFDGKVA